MLRNPVLTLVLLLTSFVMVVPAPIAFADPPCVEEGEDVDVDFGNPDLPPGAEIVDGEGFEHDTFSTNDPMGAGVVGASNTTLNVANRGGSLSGPNGQSQNGGFEGDCIEVFITWKIRKPVKKTRTPFHLDIPWTGGGVTTTTWTDWVYYYVDSGTQDVCPC